MTIERDLALLGIQLDNVLALLDQSGVGFDDPDDRAILYNAKQANIARQEGWLSELFDQWDREEVPPESGERTIVRVNQR